MASSSEVCDIVSIFNRGSTMSVSTYLLRYINTTANIQYHPNTSITPPSSSSSSRLIVSHLSRSPPFLSRPLKCFSVRHFPPKFKILKPPVVSGPERSHQEKRAMMLVNQPQTSNIKHPSSQLTSQSSSWASSFGWEEAYYLPEEVIDAYST